MRLLIWIFRIVLFLALLVLGIKNDDLVTVQAFLGGQWQVPLIFVMLIMFAIGAVLGVTVSLTTVFSQRLELKRLRKKLQKLEAVPLPPSKTEPTSGMLRELEANIHEHV